MEELTVDKLCVLCSDNAPEILRLGIPAYEWLNDDVHGARFPNATTFPNGCGLGATWSTKILSDVSTTTNTLLHMH
jgi:beta-glucosidase